METQKIKIISYRGKDALPVDLTPLKNQIEQLKGNITDWKSSQEQANGVFDSSIAEIEIKVNELIAELERVKEFDISSLNLLVESLNSKFSSYSTKKEIGSLEDKIQRNILDIIELLKNNSQEIEKIKSEIPTIVSDSDNVTVEKRGNEYGISVDIPKIKQIVQGGGISKTTVQSMIDESLIGYTPGTGDYVLKSGDTMTGTLAMTGAGIQLDINYEPAWSEGKVFYDVESHTLSYFNDNADVKINVGQEEVVRVRNQTGSSILNGQVVCISGSSGSHPLIVLADNSSPTLSHSTLGVATHNISDNENGYITVSGLVNGLDTSGFSAEGITLWLDTAGNIIETEPTAPIHKVKIGYLIRKHNTQGSILVHIDTGSDLKDLHDVSIGDYEDGDLLVANGAVWQPGANVNDLATKVEVASISGGLYSRIDSIEELHRNTIEPTGFVATNTTSTLTIDEVNRIVTVTPGISGAEVYVKGTLITLTAPISASFTDVEGNHFFVIDQNGSFTGLTAAQIGAIHGCSVLDYILRNNAFVAEIYWDAANNKALLFDERHGCIMDSSTHYNLHIAEGTRYITGLVPGNIIVDGNGSSNTHVQFSTTTGSILDEDVISTILTKGVNDSIPVLYQLGATGTWRWAASPAPIANTGSGRAGYNLNSGGNWSLAEVTNNSFVLAHIFGSPILNYSGIFAMIGQNEYNTIASARIGAATEIANLITSGLAMPEFVPIATFIIQTSNSYSNTYKSIFRSIDTGEEYVNWLGTKQFTSAGAATIHNNLGGLQGGSLGEYFHLTASQASDFIGRSEVATISGALSNYTLLSTTASISGDIVNQASQISQLSGNAISQASQIAALSGGSSTSYVSQTQLGVWNITGSANNKINFVSASTDNPLGNNSNLFFGININYNGSNAYSTQFAGRNGYFALRSLENNVFGPWNKIWTDQNDGIGSGLDADLLDGQHGSYYISQSAAMSANAVSQINNNLGTLIYQVSGTNISQASQIASISAAIANISGGSISATGTGFIVQTAPNTYVTRSLSPGTGISITNGGGLSAPVTITVNDYISRLDVTTISASQQTQLDNIVSLNNNQASQIASISANLLNITGAGITPVVHMRSSNAGQSLSIARNTIIYEDLDYSTGGGTWATSGAFYVPSAGYYHVSATVTPDAVSSATLFSTYIYVNGNEYKSEQWREQAATSDLRTFDVEGVVYCNANDYIRVLFYTSIGYNIYADSNYNRLAIHKVG